MEGQLSSTTTGGPFRHLFRRLPTDATRDEIARIDVARMIDPRATDSLPRRISPVLVLRLSRFRDYLPLCLAARIWSAKSAKSSRSRRRSTRHARYRPKNLAAKEAPLKLIVRQRRQDCRSVMYIMYACRLKKSHFEGERCIVKFNAYPGSMYVFPGMPNNR